MSGLLNTGEAAMFLRLRPQTLESWRVQGRPPKFLKIGRLVYYEVAELERFIDQCQRHSTSDDGGDVQ